MMMMNEAAKKLTAEEQAQQEQRIQSATAGLADILADILAEPEALKATA